MIVKFYKYQALGNDFIVLQNLDKVSKKKLSELALSICDRNYGVGADGIVVITESSKADWKFNIYNSDGSWAEKSGNGLRIAGLHLFLENKIKKFTFETANGIEQVEIVKKQKNDYMVKTSLGEPKFEVEAVPVKVKQKFMINSPIKVGEVDFPVTCLSLGNPHTVLFVGDFNFDWETLGADIENHKLFPNRTNVEFVKIMTKKKIKVADWERGAGATGSSGTGAAASVAAGVINGQLDRICEVIFENGSLFIDWKNSDNQIELTGPVEFLCNGDYNF